ncbi:hypothetical protein E2562_003118 [Oryza meyeriana var. granulata]|uniref:Uncharacterized protein n=1 Tax=Oryza meyeriana var. granulata TaxID=110450 RepID=A0A6G1E9B5_9ORYZ|nr:hypothetical protein E2562_003118 [Oryza meyeriana var. granulata]
MELASETMPQGTAFMSLGARPHPVAREEMPAGSTPSIRVSLAATPRSRDAFPEVLETAQEIVERLEVAAAEERAELKREHSDRVEERGWLEATHKLLDVHVRAADYHYNWIYRITNKGNILHVSLDADVIVRLLT